MQRHHGSILTTKDLRGHKTNLNTTQSASRPLRARKHGFERAETGLCARDDRIVSVTGDLSMQEELCSYILTLVMIKAARIQFWQSESPQCKLKLRAERHLYSLT